jgi:hypothetical protein
MATSSVGMETISGPGFLMRAPIEIEVCGPRRKRNVLLSFGESFERGGRFRSTITSVAVTAMLLPARIRKGTSAQRQESIRRRTAAKVSTVESGLTPGLLPVPVELAAHDVRGLERLDRTEDLDLLVAHGVRVERRRRLHRQQRDDLEQVVLDDVADRARLVVETSRGPRRRTPRPS